jgi:RNA polymerase sigma factor (sigma-70 family)
MNNSTKNTGQFAVTSTDMPYDTSTELSSNSDLFVFDDAQIQHQFGLYRKNPTKQTIENLYESVRPHITRFVKSLSQGFSQDFYEENLSIATSTFMGILTKYTDSQGLFRPYLLTRITGSIRDNTRKITHVNRRGRKHYTQWLKFCELPQSKELSEQQLMAQYCAQQKIPLRRLQQYIQTQGFTRFMSLDQPLEFVGESNPQTLTDILVSDDNSPVELIEKADYLAYIQNVVEKLPPRYRAIARGLMSDMRRDDLAQSLGIAESRVNVEIKNIGIRYGTLFRRK